VKIRSAPSAQKKKKATKRLIPGERDTATGVLTRINARDLFLQTIADKAQVVLDDLKDEPSQLFIAADLHQRPFSHVLNLWDYLACVEGAHMFLDRRAVMIYECLRAWSEKYHVQAEDQWFEERGFFTLYEWHTNPSSRYGWNYCPGSYGTSLPPDPPPGVKMIYDPLWQRRADYIDSLSREASRRIEADPLLSLADGGRKKGLAASLDNSKTIIDYCKAVEAVADGDGCQKVDALPELQKYMDWTVETRVLRKTSVTKIAEDTRLGYRSVQKGIKKILDLVGLPSNSRGRPSGIVEMVPRNNPTR
jgi:hypothetical protein